MTGAGAGAGASKRVRLEEVSVPRLLFALLRQRFSGTLVLEQPPPHPGRRTVWVRGGMPVFTDWVAPSEVLGQVLQGLRFVTEDQLRRALEAMAAQGGLLGQQLLAQGVLDRPRLLEALRQQCVRKLVGVFALRAGEATVVVGDGSGVDDDLLPLNVLGLVLAAVGVTYDEARVEAELGAALRAPLQATGALARYRSYFRFRPADEPIVRALEQGTTLARLADLPGAGRRRAAQLVYVLWACQMLRTGEAVTSTSAPLGSGRQAVPTPIPTAPSGPVSLAPAPAARAPVPTPVPTARAPVPTPVPTARAPVPTPVPTARASVPTPAPRPLRTRQTADDLPAMGSAEPDGAGDTFEAELEALEAKLAKNAHAFALFGLPLTATKRDVRKAWGELSRRFHPDALQSQGRGHLRERVSDVFAALSEAQQALGDAEQRDKLRAAIENGEHEPAKHGQDATARAHAAFQSELMAKDADKLLRANRFDRALDRYREAAKYAPDEPDLTAAIAWCEYQLSSKEPNEVTQARARLAQVIEQAPNVARAHYFLGFVLVDARRSSAAIESFRRAAGLDPRLIDAERQARALELRAGQAAAAGDKKGRGGLKGLFGKK